MKKILTILYRLFVLLLVWVSVTTMVQAYKCTELTQSELFSRIPRSFIFDFKVCE